MMRDVERQKAARTSKNKAAFGGAIYCSKLQQVAEYATQTCSTRLVRHFE
jgi:hypothetical protein